MTGITAKSLGFKKGDCVVIDDAFVGVLMLDVHTCAPCCEVWGLAHESGSVYAESLKKITPEQLMDTNYYKADPKPFSKEAKKALRG